MFLHNEFMNLRQKIVSSSEMKYHTLSDKMLAVKTAENLTCRRKFLSAEIFVMSKHIFFWLSVWGIRNRWKIYVGQFRVGAENFCPLIFCTIRYADLLNVVSVIKPYHLIISAFFVGEFNLREDDGIFGPMSPEVRGIRMNVDTAVSCAFGFAPSRPFPVDELPLVIVDRDEVQHYRIHGVGVESFHR